METKTYPKIGRIPMGDTIVGKRYLTKTEVDDILDGEVCIEEKIDGKNINLPMEWDEKQYEIYAEYCKLKHSIPYDKLPAWNIVLDVWDYDKSKFMDWDEKYSFCERLGFQFMLAPLIARAKVSRMEDLTSFFIKSVFATNQMAEGIVIKNYEKQLFAKLVRKEFIEGIEDHWMTKPKEMNRLA